MTRTLVIDGNNLASRAVHAAYRTGMSSGEQATGGLHIFIRMVARYIREIEPDALVVCWDGGRSHYRSQLYPAYKAARPERTESSRSQFTLAKEFLALANIHHVEQPGVEADDLVAAYWKRRKSDERITILSGDKDFLQLLDGATNQIRPSGGQAEDDNWDAMRVREEMGCTPTQLPLVMALTGDISDGIPGIPGCGPKTALKWLSKYDWSLDALCDREPKMNGQRETVHTYLRLVSLRDGEAVPIVPDPPRFDPTTPRSMMAGEFEAFLQQYRLDSTRKSWIAGTLWTAPVEAGRGDGKGESVSV